MSKQIDSSLFPSSNHFLKSWEEISVGVGSKMTSANRPRAEPSRRLSPSLFFTLLKRTLTIRVRTRSRSSEVPKPLRYRHVLRRGFSCSDNPEEKNNIGSLIHVWISSMLSSACFSLSRRGFFLQLLLADASFRLFFPPTVVIVLPGELLSLAAWSAPLSTELLSPARWSAPLSDAVVLLGGLLSLARWSASPCTAIVPSGELVSLAAWLSAVIVPCRQIVKL